MVLTILHDKTARVLCTLSPASIGPAYFREIATVINAGGPPGYAKSTCHNENLRA
jgi:hypothetical protein